MNQYSLKITFLQLTEKVQKQKIKAEKLQFYSIASTVELESARKEKRAWINETVEVLQNCFIESNNEMINELRNCPSYTGGFHIPNSPITFSTENIKFKASIKSYIDGLGYFMTYAKLSDIMINPEIVILNKRKEYTIEEKQKFILNKLRKVNTGGYYDIKRILELNGIELNHNHEELELINDLEDMGMIDSLKTLQGGSAKITIQGLKFLEQNEKEISDSENKVTEQDYEAMTSKIDEMLVHLEKAGVEREILFNEMEELKELYLKLNKKNWKQIVLGKLVDLAMSKVLERDALSFIYEHLTGNPLKLLQV